jgi:hypothetical protein
VRFWVALNRRQPAACGPAMSPQCSTSPAVVVAAILRHPLRFSDRRRLYANSRHFLDPYCLPLALAAEFAAAGSTDRVSLVAGLVIEPRSADPFGGSS